MHLEICNLLTARQFGSHSGYSVDETQVWAYDARQRLCRHVTPQEGHTLYAYDAAGQLIGEARGAPAGSGCASLPGSKTVTTSYDLMGRPDLIDFPDSSPDIDFDYDADGNMTRAARGSAVWTYAHDAMDQLTDETLAIDGRSYAGSYTYTADGRLNTRVTPGGRVISFAPNGHGLAADLSLAPPSLYIAAAGGRERPRGGGEGAPGGRAPHPHRSS